MLRGDGGLSGWFLVCLVEGKGEWEEMVRRLWLKRELNRGRKAGGGGNKEGNAVAGAREGRLVYVVEVFFSKGGSGGLEKMRGKGGRRRSLERDGFRVRVFFFCIFLMFQNFPLICVC